jgi:hypothetical protein
MNCNCSCKAGEGYVEYVPGWELRSTTLTDRAGLCRVCKPKGSVPVDDLLRHGRRVGIEGPSSHSTAVSKDPLGPI